MRFLLAAVLLGCGSQVTTAPSSDATPIDSSIDTDTDDALIDTAAKPDTAPPMVDTTPPIPGGCTLDDPANPPIACGPEGGGAVPCSTTSKVDFCPLDNPCMARVKQSDPILEYRMGRMRLWAPDALLSLSAIAIDPNVNARCANAGAESLNWLFRVNRTAMTLQTGGARTSIDGAKFSFLNESISAPSFASVCPGFVGPATPIDLRPVTATITATGTGFETPLIAAVNIPIYDSSGTPIILPLREAKVRVPSITDPSCIGSWNRKYWCDGDSLGWTTGGSILAKITAEEADRVPIKSAGCQSLCAILVNDATKTDGKLCKRGSDGKVPAVGTHCVGGAGCNNAFLLSITFGAYGVDIVP